ncbi:MAG: ABC transporter ATP-binding protein [Phycisphaerae bacterium]|nr:ABC transporter ATP-binding protein [Phycisphaerae bacterium]
MTLDGTTTRTGQEPGPDPIVRLVNLHRSFGTKEVLRGLDVDFAEGRTTVVLGPSGCGKSVMLKHIVGLLRPDFGEVYFDDRRIDTMSERELVQARSQMGFLFQQSALFDSMNVRQNIAFPLREHGIAQDKREILIRDVLAKVGLIDQVDSMPASLSGGQRKRIALARAIVLSPRLILYDEPTTGLDPIRADVINELILKLQQTLSVTSIVVTHDLASAFKVADRLIMLHEGQVILEGDERAFKQSTNPIVMRFLRGEASPEELAEISN